MPRSRRAGGRGRIAIGVDGPDHGLEAGLGGRVHAMRGRDAEVGTFASGERGDGGVEQPRGEPREPVEGLVLGLNPVGRSHGHGRLSI